MPYPGLVQQIHPSATLRFDLPYLYSGQYASAPAAQQYPWRLRPARQAEALLIVVISLREELEQC